MDTAAGPDGATGVDAVAGAIADPVRREILLLLRDGPRTAGQVADRFAISRPAVSRHLRVLREAGLVSDTADGRRRVYTLVTGPLDELAGWLARFDRPSVWERHFDALETEVYRARRARRSAVQDSGVQESAVHDSAGRASAGRTSAGRASAGHDRQEESA